MNAGTHRLLRGAAFGCLLFLTINQVPAQDQSYSTVRPISGELKAAVYPFTMPFTNLVQMTRWNWDDRSGVCGPGGCGDAACMEGACAKPCCPCGPAGRFWARADYLLWWSRGAGVPPLVTTGSPNDPVPGALGQPNTEILFGGRTYNGDARHQYRFQFGYWLGDCRRWAIQADWLDLGQSNANFSASSEGSPILTRPFYDVLRQLEAVEIIAYPGVAEGQVDARVSNSFHSAGANLRRNLRCCFSECGSCETSCETKTSCTDALSCWRLDLIGGYRHYSLEDGVTLREQITLLEGQGGHVAGTRFDVRDSFRSRNEFHGGEIGLIAQRFRGRWSFEFLAKLAMGNNRQVVTIDGQTIIHVPGQMQLAHGGGPRGFAPANSVVPANTQVTHRGGLLALENTNIGVYERNDFALIPQFGFEVGYQLTQCSRVYMGYDLLLWWNVKRAGNHIDPRVNTSFMPPQIAPGGEPLPEFAWRSTDFWAQGLNLGWETRF